MKIAPSTPTLSIAATISSPVTWGGQFGTLCQGRLGVFASYAWTCESMMGMGDNLPQQSHVQGRSTHPQCAENDPLWNRPLSARGATRRFQRTGNRLDHG